MATFYFSGIEKAATARILQNIPGAAGMISFLQFSPHLLLASEGLRLTMDSGAFTKPLNRKAIERYAGVIVALGDRCDWYANADVIGDQEQSNANYAFLLSLLPPSLYTKVLWVYQASSSRCYLDEGLERFSSIGVGGLVHLLAQDRQAEQKVLSIARRIASASVKPHYFGLGQRRLLALLNDIHQEGNYSCDSSTWLVGSKYGLLIRKDGRQIPVNKTGFDFSSDEILAQNVRTMRQWVEPLQRQRQVIPELQLSMF